jgi:hypothetical protein
MKRLIILLSVLVFCLNASLALAAAEKWFILKDKNGICRVISADDKTPKTIAGPYTTQQKALDAKAKVCPGAAIPKVDKVKKSKLKTKTKEATSKAKKKTKAAASKSKKKTKKAASKSKKKTKETKAKDKKKKTKKTETTEEKK